MIESLLFLLLTAAVFGGPCALMCSARRARDGAAVCAACGYDLVGLSDSAVCPECGGAERGRLMRRLSGARKVRDPAAVRACVRLLLIALVPAAVVPPALSILWPVFYRRQGFSPEIIERFGRGELGDPGMLFTMGTAYLGAAAVGMLVVSRVRGRRGAYIACGLLMLTAAAQSAVVVWQWGDGARFWHEAALDGHWGVFALIVYLGVVVMAIVRS